MQSEACQRALKILGARKLEWLYLRQLNRARSVVGPRVLFAKSPHWNTQLSSAAMSAADANGIVHSIGNTQPQRSNRANFLHAVDLADSGVFGQTWHRVTTHTHTHAHTHTHTHTHPHLPTHPRTHIHTYTRAHAHSRTLSPVTLASSDTITRTAQDSAEAEFWGAGGACGWLGAGGNPRIHGCNGAQISIAYAY